MDLIFFSRALEPSLDAFNVWSEVIRSMKSSMKLDIRLPGKGDSKLPWREAGPLNYLDAKVYSDQ